MAFVRHSLGAGCCAKHLAYAYLIFHGNQDCPNFTEEKTEVLHVHVKILNT